MYVPNIDYLRYRIIEEFNNFNLQNDLQLSLIFYV